MSPSLQTSDILELHSRVCPNYNPNSPMNISLDGVSETKSTSVSLDVYSTKIDKCRNVYPLKIVRPLNKYVTDNKDMLSDVLADLEENGCHIDNFIGDNPKRAIVREAKHHGSYYACEYCTSKAFSYSQEISDPKTLNKQQLDDIDAQIQNLSDMPGTSSSIAAKQQKINDLNKKRKKLQKETLTITKKKQHLVWPPQTANGELRTRDSIIDIVEKIRLAQAGDHPNLTIDEKQGFVGTSLFLDVPDFDFIHGIPTEYMHSVCLGVVKRMLELTFSVGDKRDRNTKRKLTPPSVYNKYMRDIRVPKEFSRRARHMDFAVLKAQEMRNIILFLFPIVVLCLEKTAKERRLWLLLAFMVRSCCVPDNEFEDINNATISLACKQFYALYEQLFSVKNCTYNTHVVSSHILLMRRNGPFSFTSAFPFESFYAELRHSFTPGTVSPLKQMLQKVILRRALSHHCCDISIHYSAKDTDLECNSLIYCFIDSSHHIYKIDSCDENNPDLFYCFKQGRLPANIQECPNLPWNSVGVYRMGALDTDLITIHRNQISGKVLKVLNYLLTCPAHILREK